MERVASSGGKKRPDIIAIYGNVSIPKRWCPDCKSYAFVVDGELACCYAPVEDFSPTIYKRESEPEQRRRLPTQEQRDLCLEEQEWRCFYCDRSFGRYILKGGRMVRLSACWDHYIPYALLQNNHPTNFVAACQVCNSIKSSMCFYTVEQARAYIMGIWEAKGHRDA